MRNRMSVLTISLSFILLFSIALCSSCAAQPDAVLSEMYKDRYLNEGGEHYYLFDAGKVTEHKANLAGTPDDKLDFDSPYELVFVNAFKDADPYTGEILQWLEYDIINHRDYMINLPTYQMRLERQITGKWFACISEGSLSRLETIEFFPERPVRRRICLSRSEYTDASKSRLRWVDLPTGHYRLLQKFDTHYVVMEFDLQ